MRETEHRSARAGPSRRNLLTAGALAVAAAGCGSGTSGRGAGNAPERPHIRVGAVQSVTASGLYLAVQRLQRIADEMKTFGMIAHPLDVTGMLAT